MCKIRNKYFPQLRERAVRMDMNGAEQHESRCSAIPSISSKIGCARQTLNEWVKNAEVDRGERTGVTIKMAEKMKALERRNRELKQANEILQKASAYFAQVGARSPVQNMIAFIEENRDIGGELICKHLSIAPSITRQANCAAILPRGHVPRPHAQAGEP